MGDIYYYDAVRVNLGLFQHDVNVLWDLAVHDLSILDYVVNLAPCGVSVTGISHVPGGMENSCLFDVVFPRTRDCTRSCELACPNENSTNTAWGKSENDCV